MSDEQIKMTFESVLPLGKRDAMGDILDPAGMTIDPASKIHVQQAPSGVGFDLPKSVRVTSVSPVAGHEDSGLVSVGFTADERDIMHVDRVPALIATFDVPTVRDGETLSVKPEIVSPAEPKPETWRDREPLL